MTTTSNDSTSEPDEGMPFAVRRDLIELIAEGDFDNIDLADTGSSTLSYVLQAICMELAHLSVMLEDETQPALKVAGSMLGGLFGIGTTSDDETIIGVHSAGASMREHIRHSIGVTCGDCCPGGSKARVAS